jgi:hypothetical protein
MATLFATYCSADKRRDEGDLPASVRYVSARIEDTVRRGQTPNARAGILSGRYGLIAPEHPIPWYDHLLRTDEVDDMVPQVVDTLREWKIESVRWFTVDVTKDPDVAVYCHVMDRACANLGITMSEVVVEMI